MNTPEHRPLLIGLTGRAGCGKTTVAQMLEDELAFEHIAFADPIVNMIGQLFADCDIGGEWITERALKEQPTTLGFSYRHLAQTLGTEWARKTVAEDFWLRVAGLRLVPLRHMGLNVVISDVRFPNEAEWLAAQGGHLVRVLRHDGPAVRAHESEAHSDHFQVTTELLNFGSLSTLLDQVTRMVDTLRSQHRAP